MDSATNHLILEGNKLSKDIDDNILTLKANGFVDETNTRLKADLQSLIEKNTAQQQAENDAESKTAEQNMIVSGVHDLLKRVRNSVRSAFGDDGITFSSFKVDEPIPGSVKNLCSLCEYTYPLVVTESVELLKNGLMQSDIDELGTASGRIMAIDAEQEATRKVKKAATLIRNKAADKLYKTIKSIRSFIKARFEKQPEIAILFEPIPKGRGASGNGEEENQNPPAQPTPPTP